MCFAAEIDQSRGLGSEEELAFGREVLTRLPLAEAVLWLWRWVADEAVLQELFNRERGRCYEQVLRFPVSWCAVGVGAVIADALLEHRGSGRKSFQEFARPGARTKAGGESDESASGRCMRSSGGCPWA